MLECLRVGSALEAITVTSITPLLRGFSGHGQELMPNAELQKLRKENLGDKNFVGGKFAGRDCLVVSIRSDGFTKIVPAFSAIAWFSDHFVRISPAEFVR